MKGILVRRIGFTRTTLLACMALAFLTAPATGQSFSTVVNFTGSNGANPFFGNLIRGRDGKLYGTTYNGGANGLGAVMRINVATRNSIVLHSFTGSDGANPGSGLTLATDGNYYGATVLGGSAGYGVLYKITAGGTYTVLHHFTGGSDGAYPYGPPIEASDGNLYGTTSGAAVLGSTVYKLTRGGVYSVVTTLVRATDGNATFGLSQSTNGLLYLSTNIGGPSECGTVVKLTTAGVIKGVHSFPCGNGGAAPVGIPVQASDGNFYGGTQSGGSHGEGVLYKVVSSTFGVNVIYNFDSKPGSAESPETTLLQATDGKLYGVSYQSQNGGAVIFNWTLGGTYSQVYSLPNSSFIGSLMQDTSGLLYGMSYIGGTNDLGYVYSLDNGLGPFVAFVRAQGKVGATAQILGQGFTGTTSVSFNGVAASSFSVVSDTYMTAVVPSGATTGPVVVTTPSGTLASNVNFRVTQ